MIFKNKYPVHYFSFQIATFKIDSLLKKRKKKAAEVPLLVNMRAKGFRDELREGSSWFCRLHLGKSDAKCAQTSASLDQEKWFCGEPTVWK